MKNIDLTDLRSKINNSQFEIDNQIKDELDQLRIQNNEIQSQLK